MGFAFFATLRQFLDHHQGDPRVDRLRQKLAQCLSRCQPGQMVALYEEALDLAETLFWEAGADEDSLARLQALYREQEQLRSIAGNDERHRFLVVIPVADRPRQLEACLESLWLLLQRFEYGAGVQVLLADDSREPASRARHAELAAEYGARGLEVEVFDQQAQQALFASLPAAQRAVLEEVVGPGASGAWWHKGPSRMRNLTLLHLARLARRDPRLLFFFIDSDEAFGVLHCQGGGARELAAVNHFHHLDRIFFRFPVQVLTGKVVGDPPVAPAVMAGNFLQDVDAFLTTLGEGAGASPCPFHGQGPEADEGAYHDMADLFGLAPRMEAHAYHCAREEPHERQQAMEDFSARLDRFFDGEHPTRRTCYRHRPVLESLQPARTVYTGNFVVNAEGLRHFIPFAGLRLRMAGPTLGRLLRVEIGEGFRSANLPLLHRRATEEAGSEFRPGVERRAQRVDLADEFERQFYGDLMLFSMERLTGEGFPRRGKSEREVDQVLSEVLSELEGRYGARQEQVERQLHQLRQRLEDPRAWWHRREGSESALAAFRHFLANMEANFGPGSPAMARILDRSRRSRWLERMRTAILAYPAQRRAWEAVLQHI